MLNPRDAATDDEASDDESPSESVTTRSIASEDERAAVPPTVSSLQGHALHIGDSPLVSEDDTAVTDSSRQEELDENTAVRAPSVETKGRGGPQPYDVPVVGAFYMHDDRSATGPRTAPPPRTYEQIELISCRWQQACADIRLRRDMKASMRIAGNTTNLKSWNASFLANRCEFDVFSIPEV